VIFSEVRIDVYDTGIPSCLRQTKGQSTHTLV